MRRLWGLAFCLGVLGGLLPAIATADSPALCGRYDLPETGLQGDIPRRDQLSGRAERGYNCGLAVVGHTDLGRRGANANMAWAGNCAYIAGDGIAVVDVSDPQHPRHVTTLHGPGSDSTLETIAARTFGGRAVLVAGRYGLLPLSGPAPMDIYDVRDCARPKLMSTFQFPTNIHNLTLSPDTHRVYTTLPMQVADITDLARPRYVGRIEREIPNPPPPVRNLSHEVETSADESRVYVGGQVIGIGETFTILDVSGWPASPPRIVSQVPGRGHSIRRATIKGRPYLLRSEESILNPTAKGCLPERLNPVAGASEPYLMDISDETQPVDIAQFRLEINKPPNCLAQVLSGVNASVHYHDVDDPADTTFAMLSMWHAGLRIADLRDPLNPREIAYFNPGAWATRAQGPRLDQAWAHVRYAPETGHIWFTTRTGGFWVLELEPQVRSALGLSPRPSVWPNGAPARPESTFVAVADEVADVRPLYCTVG
jgi:hypothetical protein